MTQLPLQLLAGDTPASTGVEFMHCKRLMMRTMIGIPSLRKFHRRMSRFPAHCCIKEYETILFRNKETPSCVGSNHPGRPGNIPSRYLRKP